MWMLPLFLHINQKSDYDIMIVQEKKQKIDFQDGSHGGHLGFPIITILAIFVLQVTPMLPNKYLVNWPRGVGGVGF